jgi:hypothetical protein
VNSNNREETIRIETQRPRTAVHVVPGELGVDLTIGEWTEAGTRSTALSLPQARMLAHALGLAVARVEERQRIEAEERAWMAQRMLDQEFRRDSTPRPTHRPGGEWEPVVLGPRSHPSVVRPLLDEGLRGRPYDYGIPARDEGELSQEEGAGNSCS